MASNNLLRGQSDMMRNSVVLVSLVLGVLFVGACTTVRRVQPAAYLAEKNPEVVWVTYTNNTVILVAEPVIIRDTLRGKGPVRHERVKIPLSEVQSVQAKVADHTKTALLVTALGVAAITSVYFGLVANAGTAGSGIDCGVDRKGDVIQEC
jgi:hypothetical protein